MAGQYVSFDEIVTAFGVVGAALGFIVLAWNAFKAVYEWRMSLSKPTRDALDDHEGRLEDHEGRLVNLEECCAETRAKLDADWKWQQDEREINSLMLRSIKHLLQHEVDGNDTSALVQMEAEIDNWLFDHQR